jgi:AmmeMemoRadiSam system protein A
MHQLVKLAKETIETYVIKGQTIKPPESVDKKYMNNKAGVFVSLKIDNHLRGCIGTFMPVTENIAEEVIRNAILAATGDPRFPPVSEHELPVIQYSIDILSPPEKISDISELDHKKYGIIVVSDYKKGLLLPDLEGVNSVEEQITIAKSKAGIMSDEEVEIFRFEVKREH